MTWIFQPGGPPRFAHQKRGLWDIIHNGGRHALLFDPGTGKTATTLDYASVLALKQGSARVLVVAPLAAVDTWVLQAEEFVADGIDVWSEALGGGIAQRLEAMDARGKGDFKTGKRRALAQMHREVPDAKAHLLILSVNLDTFSSRRAVTKTLTMADRVVQAVKRFKPDLVVIDEIHRIKSPYSNTSRCLARLTPFCPRRIGLTGTVMPHSPLDIYAQWRFLDNEAFSIPYEDQRIPMDFAAFRDRYAKMGGYMGKEVKGYQRADELKEIMHRRATVARKSEVLDLPKVTDTLVPVNLSAKEAKAYEDMRAKQAATVGSHRATVPNRLVQRLRLRQITCGFMQADDGTMVRLGTSRQDTALSLLTDTLTRENRVVVFAHFVPEITALAEAVRKIPKRDDGRFDEVMVISGDTPRPERALMRARFGDVDKYPERTLLIAQIHTLSLAVNELVAANHAIFLSLSEQRDDLVQARDRLDRQGQTRPVTFWNLQAPKTVDEIIWSSHMQRGDLEAMMLDHVNG